MCKETRDNYTIKYPTLMSRYSNMMERCYNSEYHLYPYYGALGVTVCDYWRDPDQGYKRYVNWILSQKTVEEMQGLQVDKDRLSAKLGIEPAMYSPETCCILTAAENAQSRKLLKSTNTSGYRGIAAKGNKWKTTCILNGASYGLGTWPTKIEAAKAYDYFNILMGSKSTLNGVLEEGETIPSITKEGYTNPSHSSKLYGVSYDNARGKWAAQVYFNKKRVPLGRFPTELEAFEAVREFCTVNHHNLHKIKEP